MRNRSTCTANELIPTDQRPWMIYADEVHPGPTSLQLASSGCALRYRGARLGAAGHFSTPTRPTQNWDLRLIAAARDQKSFAKGHQAMSGALGNEKGLSRFRLHAVDRLPEDLCYISGS
jgi:hypothetical protein